MGRMWSTENGFGLIEIMISCGIGIILLSGFAHMLTFQNSQVAQLRAKSELVDIGNDIRRALRDPQICLATFKDLKINHSDMKQNESSVVSAIKDGTDLQSPLLAAKGLEITNLSTKVSFGAPKTLNWQKLSANGFKFDLLLPLETSGASLVPIKILRIVIYTHPVTLEPVRCALSSENSASCRDVSVSATNNKGAEAWCDVGETLIFGGGACTPSVAIPFQQTETDYSVYFSELSDAYVGYSVQNELITDGNGRQGWRYDCYNKKGQDAAYSRAFAKCCL